MATLTEELGKLAAEAIYKRGQQVEEEKKSAAPPPRKGMEEATELGRARRQDRQHIFRRHD
jgi:hypothetical protein